MPLMQVRGAAIRYEILGGEGPWVALSPGGRRGMDAIEGLARHVAKAGYRVLMHDRRNCGASDVVIDDSDSEYGIWTEDLYEMLTRLDALPAHVGGGSSGCRLSLLFALRHPEAVRSLLLWRVTGGHFASQRLANQYYGQFIAAAEQGGMAAVCATEHFGERIAARPENRTRLMDMDPQRFLAVMAHWREYFIAGADLPVIGATEEELQSIQAPACVIPGNDKTHARPVGENLHRILPRSELHVVFPEHIDVDIVPPEEWREKDGEIAAIFTGFMKRTEAPVAA